MDYGYTILGRIQKSPLGALDNHNYRYKPSFLYQYINITLSTCVSAAFSCPHCPDKKFKWKSGLRAHLEKHGNNEATFACEKCGEMFISKRLLHVHKKLVASILFYSIRIALFGP